MKTNAKYWIETFRGKVTEGAHPVAAHYWRIVSRNGQVLAHSEGYRSRSSRDRVAARFSLATGLEVRKEPS